MKRLFKRVSRQEMEKERFYMALGIKSKDGAEVIYAIGLPEMAVVLTVITGCCYLLHYLGA